MYIKIDFKKFKLWPIYNTISIVDIKLMTWPHFVKIEIRIVKKILERRVKFFKEAINFFFLKRLTSRLNFISDLF
jgi:hypothetical protein